MNRMRWIGRGILLALTLVVLFATAIAQETTGGLQGTVKDATGAVVAGAQVSISGSALVGSKQTTADSAGYYRFANLPPGKYVLTVTEKGFQTIKREGLIVEVGHLPTIDFTLRVGASDTTVIEVTEAAPLIDVTSTKDQTNITNDVIAEAPHGRSYQSVIQFAPAARNEPLQGDHGVSATATGYQIAGGADSENAYLVEGQDTQDIKGGASNANVPFEFIQEVQVKTSGVEAEHGGALGGVVNVVMKRGSNAFHGEVWAWLEKNNFDAAPVPTLRLDPRERSLAALTMLRRLITTSRITTPMFSRVAPSVVRL